MAKKQTFPKLMYVKIDSNDDGEWFLADEDAAGLVGMGESVKVATYQLIDVRQATGVAEFAKAAKPRR
jgi:hypothetical protein